MPVNISYTRTGVVSGKPAKIFALRGNIPTGKEFPVLPNTSPYLQLMENQGGH